MGKFVLPDDCTMFVKSGTTEFAVISDTGGLYHQGAMLPNSSLIGPLANVTWPTTGVQTLVNTTDSQALQNKTLNAGCVFVSAVGTSEATIPNCGLTNISASTSPFTATLAAPLAGMLKFIHVSAANTSDVVTIDASTSVEIGVVGSTASYRKMAFTCKGSAMLLGVSTARWDVLSIGTTLVGTATLPTFTT